VASHDTRARILEVARRRFTEQGYEGTSLREIADDLGVTKAALYYHFQSKDEIMVALLEPFTALILEFRQRLESADGLEAWADALTHVIEQIPQHAELFTLVVNNRASIAALRALEQFAEHMEMHNFVERVIRAKSPDIHVQVRMVAALATVTGFDDWAPTLMMETPPDVLVAELTGTVRDILGLPAKVAATAR
jgi:AcrR family transcriptional regulator